MIDKRIKRPVDCMGCFGCANICPQACITMEDDSEGFWYPLVDYDRCIECMKCIDVCPIINSIKVDNEPQALACFNNDEAVRIKSSSGGVFSLIADNILSDSGVVFGVGFDKQFRVIHSCSENMEGVDNFRGSKYVQSKVGDTYKQAKKYLKLGKKVLFTGTPCQISGLNQYIGNQYPNLYTLDNICHGVPSPKVWEKYLVYRETKSGSPTVKVSFREKSKGWKSYSVKFSFDDDTEYKKTARKDSFMRAFLKNVCLRPSCYECKFKSLHRESDITLGDFWGIQHILPEMDDDKGASLIFVNTKKGHSMLREIENGLSFKEVNINQAVKYNSAAVKSVEKNPNRQLFFNDLDRLEFDKLVRKYCNDKLTIKLKRKIKSLLKRMKI